MDEMEKMKIEDAKILENPGIEFRNKLNEIFERLTAYENSLINDFADKIILFIIHGYFNKVEKRIFVENKPNTTSFIFKISDQIFPKILWDKIRDLWNKGAYETLILKEELINSINLKLKSPDIKIYEIIIGYSDVEISLYYERVDKPKNEN